MFDLANANINGGTRPPRDTRAARVARLAQLATMGEPLFSEEGLNISPLEEVCLGPQKKGADTVVEDTPEEGHPLEGCFSVELTEAWQDEVVSLCELYTD